MDILGIIEGWSKLGVDMALDRMPQQAKERLLICNSCTTRTNLVCDSSKGGCGCVLIAKARATSTGKPCPLGKWKTVDSKYK